MKTIQYPYIWLFCGFAALGACLYGYDGVYFNGVSTLGMAPFLRIQSAYLLTDHEMFLFVTSASATPMANMRSRLPTCL